MLFSNSDTPSKDVTFNKHESYFMTPYLWRGVQSLKIMMRIFCLPSLLISLNIPLSKPVSRSVRNPECETLENLLENSNSAPENVRFG